MPSHEHGNRATPLCGTQLAGLTLPEGAPPLVIPHGRIRRATQTDRDLFLGSSHSVQTVFETTFPSRVYSVREHKFDDAEDPFSDVRKYETRIQSAYRTFGHSLDLVRLSLLLASPSDKRLITVEGVVVA